MTNVWLVRAGRRGERESLALESEMATIGWAETGDLTAAVTREDIRQKLEAVHPEQSRYTISNWTSQIYPFRSLMQTGDIVAMPLKHTSGIALGRVASDYTYFPEYSQLDAAHARLVHWVRPNVPRAEFGQDLLYSLGAFMTVCSITRNNAVERIERIIAGYPDGLGSMAAGQRPNGEAPVPADTEISRDLEEEARATIMDFIIRKFKGHDLQNVVQAVLEAQGYVVKAAEKGADGGVDLTAGRGDLGFDPPRMCVQVKSESGRIDVKPLRELRGALKDFGADHGLFVAWGGFTAAAEREARRTFFQVRLWTGEQLVNELLNVYSRLPEEMRLLIPLRQIWTLMPSEDEAKG